MKKRYHLFLLAFVLGLVLSSCKSSQSSHSSIDENIYLSDAGAMKIEKYLDGLSARKTFLTSSSLFDEDDTEDLSLEVVFSQKTFNQSSEKITSISDQLAHIIIESLPYTGGYNDLSISFKEIDDDDNEKYFHYSIDSVINSQSILNNTPGDAFHSQFKKAEMAFQSLDYEKTIGHLNNVIDYNPNWKEALELRAESFVELNHHEYAIDDYNSLLILDDTEPKYYFLKGKSYLEINANGTARDNFNEVLALTDSTHIESLIFLGEIEYDESYNMKAISFFSKAISLDSTNQKIYLARRKAYSSFGSSELACADLIKASKLGPLEYGLSLQLKYCKSQTP